MKTMMRDAIANLPAPLPILIQDSYRYLRYGQIRRRRRSQKKILGRLGGGGVIQGPFLGMSYISSAFCSEILPKLVGTYELEISPAIEAICRAGCDRIIDIGAAEGYYAVGLALRNPDAAVIGFEMNPSARYYLQKLAERNGVSAQIEVRGICDLDSLAQALDGAQKPAVVSDCEGAEAFLLNPDRVEPLRRAFILVETHDGMKTDSGLMEGITNRLLERFGVTHEIEVIASRERTRNDLPPGTDLSDEEAAQAMDEGRPWAQWLFLTPRR
jgi:hypothetical protein